MNLLDRLPSHAQVVDCNPEFDDSRERWLRGPWDDEPDFVRWIDPVTRYNCMVRRTPLGSLCGYVGITSDHPSFGLHGSVTWCNFFKEIPEDVQLFWIGFDCAHFHDLIPGMPMPSGPDGVYRTLEYVIAEVLSLALQLKEIEDGV